MGRRKGQAHVVTEQQKQKTTVGCAVVRQLRMHMGGRKDQVHIESEEQMQQTQTQICEAVGGARQCKDALCQWHMAKS